jgi:hypothetical protein
MGGCDTAALLDLFRLGEQPDISNSEGYRLRDGVKSQTIDLTRIFAVGCSPNTSQWAEPIQDLAQILLRPQVGQTWHGEYPDAVDYEVTRTDADGTVEVLIDGTYLLQCQPGTVRLELADES